MDKYHIVGKNNLTGVPMFDSIKLTLNQAGLLFAIFIIIVLLVLLGFKSAKLKKILTELLIKKSELETNKLNNQINNLKQKARGLDAKRKESAAKYRNYRKSLNNNK